MKYQVKLVPDIDNYYDFLINFLKWGLLIIATLVLVFIYKIVRLSCAQPCSIICNFYNEYCALEKYWSAVLQTGDSALPTETLQGPVCRLYMSENLSSLN